MKNTKIINRLIDYYLEGSELTQDEHNTVRSLKEEMQVINYTRCCTELKDKEVLSFEDWKKRYLIDNDISGNYLHESEGWVKGNDLIKMYERELNL